MHLPILPTLLTLITYIPTSTPLTLPSSATLSQPNYTLPDSPPLHVPVCRQQTGGFNLLLCARLLTGLKDLPTYQKEAIWSEYARGSTKLPVVFVKQGATPSEKCYLTMDLYEPGTPQTAYEEFSLADEQADLNGIYFQCLKRSGAPGFARIGRWGYVSALLGPPLSEAGELAEAFANADVNGTGGGVVPLVVNLTAVETS